jgi:hypothetical protein
VEACLGRLEQERGVGIEAAVEDEEAVEGAYAREDAGLGARGDALVVEAGKEMLEVVESERYAKIVA